jgi:hypothetical protein
MRRALWGLVLLVGCRFGGVPAPAYPAFPRALPSQLGPVPVLVVDSILGADSTLNLLGGFDPRRRIIYIKSGMHPVQALQVLYHEGCHVTLWDTGLRQLMPDRLVDAVCDAQATARVAEWLADKR